ncbi:MAG: hypothetical protein J6X44_01295, partial [Thermoguttaceae bacterium]|nr:hypothetical protein [Thermoguttaceae bacterium]
DLELEQERDRQARYEAERERDEANRERDEANRRSEEANRRSEAAERRSEAAERRSEAAERRSEAAERRSMESQKKGVVRALKWKFGVDAELPENWAEGRSYDELETIADKIFECASLQEALELFQ